MTEFCYVHSDAEYPGNQLSNFYPHYFVFDGVFCAGMEGLLQSFKFPAVDTQKKICALEGIIAKKRGQQNTLFWQTYQTLWWNGRVYVRDSKEYQHLLDRAYVALFIQSPEFRKALWKSGSMSLRHVPGSDDPTKTILTRSEFLSRLLKMRTIIYNHPESLTDES